MELFRKYDVFVVSDEIWSDILLNGHTHIPTQSISEDARQRTAALYAPSKTFNLAGLVGGYSPEGQAWLDELREVLSGNVNFACSYIADRFEGVTCSKPEGTYMLFVDCTGWCRAHGKTIGELEHALWDVGVAVQDGTMFHGSCHLRMNLASPRSRIEEAFRRMDEYVFNKKD